jgi:hypothetical protein
MEDNGLYNVEAIGIDFTLPGSGEWDSAGNVKVPPIELV